MFSGYFTYSDIIFEHFFNPSRKGQATTLAFDEDEANRIAEAVGDDPVSFAANIKRDVRAIYKSQDGFGWWRGRHPRERVALLACSVLVISSTSEGDEEGFYRKFYRDVLGIEILPKNNEYAMHSTWWEELASYLNIDCAGDLGRLVFLQVVKMAHLNFPASQCILRGSDRRWLWEFFSRIIVDPSLNLSRERFLAIWRPGMPGESVGVTRMGQKLRDDSELAAQIWDIFSGEYETWRNDPAQHARVARRRQNSGRRAPASVSGQAKVEEGSEADVDDFSTRWVRSRYALSRPTFPLGAAYVLRLDVLPPEGATLEPVLADGWVRIPDHAVSARQFLKGFTLGLGELEVRVRGRDIDCFVEGPTGLSCVDTYPTGQKITLVYEDSISDQVLSFLDTHLTDKADVRLDDDLEGLAAVSGTMSLKLIEVDLPEEMRVIFSRSSMELSLRLGLRLRNGLYMPGAPPAVRFIHATKMYAPLFIDDEEVGSVQRGLNRLPASLPCGVHRVKVLDHERSFRIAFPDEVGAETPDLHDNDLGFVVRLRPPLLKTDTGALATPRAELMAQNAVVLQGADVMLPYTRTT